MDVMESIFLAFPLIAIYGIQDECGGRGETGGGMRGQGDQTFILLGAADGHRHCDGCAHRDHRAGPN